MGGVGPGGRRLRCHLKSDTTISAMKASVYPAQSILYGYTAIL